MRLLILCVLSISVSTAFFFGGGGGGGSCCCSCGTPQPARCGCQPACAPRPACPVCPAPQPCPPPPTAYCPQVSPVYVPACQGSSGGCGGNSYSYSSNNYGTSSYGNNGYATGGGSSYSGPVSFSQSEGNAGYQQSQGYNQNPGTGASYDPVTNFLQQNVAPASRSDESSNYSPPADQEFKSEPQCNPSPVKYVVLRPSKVAEDGEVEEEMEEVERLPIVESTLSPLPSENFLGDSLLSAAIEDNVSEVARALGVKTFKDAKCNSDALKQLVIRNIVKDDALSSKRKIHDESMKLFPGHSVDVICSGTGFTYLVATSEHCEVQKDNIICFVYKRPL